MNTAIATMAVVGWGLVAYWTAAIAARRGRSFWPWFAAGLLGAVILLIAAGVMKPKPTDRHFSLVVPTVAGVVGLLFLGGIVVEGVASGRPTPFSSSYAEKVAADPRAYDNWCDSDGDGTDDTNQPDESCPAPTPATVCGHSTLVRLSAGNWRHAHEQAHRGPEARSVPWLAMRW
jgi:hypothetical protein